MKLGDKVETTNPAVLLQSEDGLFRVVGPNGQIEQYECEPHKSIASIEYIGAGETRRNYLVEKIASQATGVSSKAAASGA